MNLRIIYPDTSLDPSILDLTGGKGANLLRLSAGGFNIPPFFILSTDFFDSFTASFKKELSYAISAIDTQNPATASETSAVVRGLFFQHEIQGEMAKIILSHAEALLKDGSSCAVRSSGADEDGAGASYAGQLDSFLYQKKPEDILESVLRCWASAFSQRAVAYRSASKIPQNRAKVAVIIQKIINSRVSGVTFTVNPLTCRYDEILTNCLYGLGEGIVGGAVNPDSLVIKRKSPCRVVSSEIGEKAEKFVFDNSLKRGTVRIPVEEKMQKVLCVEEKQTLQIAETSLQMEESLNQGPLDIEWALDENGRLFILQARPITALGPLQPSEDEYETIWDNSNIVESYSGTTTPLTYSFAKKAYHRVYVQFCRVLKVPEKTIAQNDFYLSGMIGLLRGRIYYNLKNWYRLISFLPGYSYNAAFMEQMMGVREKTEFSSKSESNPSGLPALMLSGVSLLWNFFTIDGKSAAFQKLVDEKFDKYKNHNFNCDDCHTLLNIYRELESSVLGNWKAPIINDFMAMISYGLLKMMIEKLSMDPDGGLQNRLLESQGNIKSTMPVEMLKSMAGTIRGNPVLTDAFRTIAPTELSKTCLGENPPEPWKPLKQQLTDYLDLFGYRSMNELKLEVPSLIENPEFLFMILKNYTATDSGIMEKTHPETSDAKNTEKAAIKSLRGRFIKGIIPAAPVFATVLSMAKKAVAFREFQRFARTNMFGLVRRIFLAIGANFVKFGVIDNRDDIFYLTTDEIFGFITGTAVSISLRAAVSARRAEFLQYENEPELPDRIMTKGPVYVNNLAASPKPPIKGNDENRLTGTSCCPGIVRGPVKVILSPSDDMTINGEILVAKRTDPGWVPLYPSASGLLIERGSILSHSAIVAREMGLPAIVGIRGITEILKTGDIVEMDGGAGTIKIQTP